MSLSIDSIRNFAGVGSITLDAQGTGITSASMQGFKSYFNIGNARQKNAETIVALHQAIVNDPRFGAQNVQAEAVRLLAEVHAERAISATQIKDIIHTDKNPPVPITATTDELVERGMEQNFIPVVDDWGSFIGIITRRNLLERFAKYKD